MQSSPLARPVLLEKLDRDRNVSPKTVLESSAGEYTPHLPGMTAYPIMQSVVMQSCSHLYHEPAARLYEGEAINGQKHACTQAVNNRPGVKWSTTNPTKAAHRTPPRKRQHGLR
eukprot:5849983-Prymnesium_polylepis.1